MIYESSCQMPLDCATQLAFVQKLHGNHRPLIVFEGCCGAMIKMNNDKLQVVVLDDDEDTRFAISRILGQCECEVSQASSVKETMHLLQQSNVDVIFSDVRIPGGEGGEELLAIVQTQHSGIPVVLMSCAMDQELRQSLMDKGAMECLRKPFYKDACMELLEQLRQPFAKSA